VGAFSFEAEGFDGFLLWGEWRGGREGRIQGHWGLEWGCEDAVAAFHFGVIVPWCWYDREEECGPASVVEDFGYDCHLGNI
jgi:hypothetical protein